MLHNVIFAKIFNWVYLRKLVSTRILKKHFQNYIRKLNYLKVKLQNHTRTKFFSLTIVKLFIFLWPHPALNWHMKSREIESNVIILKFLFSDFSLLLSVLWFSYHFILSFVFFKLKAVTQFKISSACVGHDKKNT